MPVQNLRLLTQQSSNAAVHIAADDMIHIQWRHVTFRINVTGMMYLDKFLSGDKCRTVGFEAFGSPDDGYQIWIQDIGLRLSPDDCHRFTQLIKDGITAIRQMGKTGDANHLPDCLKLTVPVYSASNLSQN